MKLFSLTEFPREPGLEVEVAEGDAQPDPVPKNVVFRVGGEASFAELHHRLRAMVEKLKKRGYACDFVHMDKALAWQRNREKWAAQDAIRRQADTGKDIKPKDDWKWN